MEDRIVTTDYRDVTST